ncbi:MAG: DUF1566 domain-containing protein [Gammaproteobacteria bacterium]|nr:DUF1566 domain-containing protein [Gammaproteobacteria bacterium]
MYRFRLKELAACFRLPWSGHFRRAAAGITLMAIMLGGCDNGTDEAAGLVFDFERLAHDADGGQCVHDRRTGLTWEVKTAAPGLRAAENTYTWYSEQPSLKPEQRGTRNGGDCQGSDCDTDAYVAAVNESALCGYRDWRLPERYDLASLNDPRIRFPGPTLTSRVFFRIPVPAVTGAALYRFQRDAAWLWGFDHGLDRVDWKSSPYHVRVVRGEPLLTEPD